ncbi:hypothetical protein AALO_G00013990 [Alosa alosa]|uniref:Uncharacterized protein n=1 Tax=Alosa alosa TaxID=278164 RepID=A0AAV6HKF0_9TELE|nr:hypothetical protein AALO_G00013990 [Alosa alosa]
MEESLFVAAANVVSCLVCFLNYEELDEVAAWNDHRIRASHNPRAPNGRPSMLYSVPHLYGGQNFGQAVDQTKIDMCLEQCSFKDYPCDVDFYHICTDLMAEHNLTMSNDIFKITDLYLNL